MSKTKQNNEGRPESDPLIDEVRRIRRKISDKYGNDVDRLIEHLRGVEQQHADRIARPEETKK